MVSGPRVADNLESAGTLVAQAADLGAELAVLPEYFPIIGATDADRVRAREMPDNGPIQDWLAATAARHGLWLVAGSIPLTASVPHKMRNASLVFDPDGLCVARYDKIHLFWFRKGEEAYDEAASIEAGDVPTAVATPFGRVVLSICYDLRFPGTVSGACSRRSYSRSRSLYRNHRPCPLGNPLARPGDREPMLRFMVGQGGQHESGRVTHGNSMIVDPREKSRPQGQGPGLVMADLDHGRIAEICASLPALAHRKIGIERP